MAIQGPLLNQLFNVIGSGQGGTVLGNGYTDKIKYIQPFIDNPEYDKNNPYGIDQETERVQIINGKPVVIGEDAPRGPSRIIAGILDKIDPSRDRDQRGPGADEWGDLPETGFGRRAEKVNPYLENPQYPGNPNLPGAGPVPQISRKGQAEQGIQQELQLRRANANTLYMKDQLFSRLANAQAFGFELDRAAMYDYLNTGRGIAETNLIAQQAPYLEDMGSAAKITARAKAQEAANEFGELGLKRTYFTT